MIWLPNNYIIKDFLFSPLKAQDVKIIYHTIDDSLTRAGYEIELLDSGHRVWLPKDQFTEAEDSYLFDNDEKHAQMTIFDV